jgi:hypothetical protein
MVMMAEDEMELQGQADKGRIGGDETPLLPSLKRKIEDEQDTSSSSSSPPLGNIDINAEEEKSKKGQHALTELNEATQGVIEEHVEAGASSPSETIPAPRKKKILIAQVWLPKRRAHQTWKRADR